MTIKTGLYWAPLQRVYILVTESDYQINEGRVWVKFVYKGEIKTTYLEYWKFQDRYQLIEDDYELE